MWTYIVDDMKRIVRADDGKAFVVIIISERHVAKVKNERHHHKQLLHQHHHRHQQQLSFVYLHTVFLRL